MPNSNEYKGVFRGDMFADRKGPELPERVELGATSFAELQKHAHDLNKLAQGLCRYYRLDNDHWANVSISVNSIEWRVSGHPYSEPLQARLSVISDYCHHDIGSLSMTGLKRFVEIKAMFDQWLAGEITEMPPSTDPQYPVLLEQKRASGKL